jgi:hypothetical protein
MEQVCISEEEEKKAGFFFQIMGNGYISVPNTGRKVGQ